MTDNLYLNMIHRLKNMTEDQLTELMFDVNDDDFSARILDVAQHYIDRESCGDCSAKQGISDHQDWRNADDDQRYNDIKSTQDSMK